MSRPAILLVTCCLEQSRYEVLRHVIASVQQRFSKQTIADMTVFDNASTYLGLGELKATFPNVVRSNYNVGYWSAIDWWLDSMKDRPPQHTYIVESDMIHTEPAAPVLRSACDLLDKHAELGAVRLHEYSVQEMHLYNKDAPVTGSRRALWQSHTNKVTGEAIQHRRIDDGPFYRTNFLTQLPALNRYPAMQEAFAHLRSLGNFTELDFQRFYHTKHPEIALYNGGIFSCNLNPYGSSGVTGSWTDPNELRRLGYLGTRFASIVPRDQYTVQIV